MFRLEGELLTFRERVGRSSKRRLIRLRAEGKSHLNFGNFNL